jgi:hypothetical protein
MGGNDITNNKIGGVAPVLVVRAIEPDGLIGMPL